MKKILTLSLGLVLVAALPGCGGKKPVIIEEETMQEEKPKAVVRTAQNMRVSGPMAEKEIGWDQDDLA